MKTARVFGAVMLPFAVWGGPAVAVAPSAARTIVVYGDSIAAESYVVLARELHRFYPHDRVVFGVFDGSSPCDWLPVAKRDQSGARLVVFTFSGNDATPCAGGGVFNADLWARGLHAEVDTWRRHHVPVLLVGPPERVVPYSTDPFDVIDRIDRREARASHARFLDGGAALRQHGQVLMRMTCLAAEHHAGQCAPDGTILVRAADGFHVCPPGGNPCPTYASGVYRWSHAIALAARGY